METADQYPIDLPPRGDTLTSYSPLIINVASS
jgi:hypothetical protein